MFRQDNLKPENAYMQALAMPTRPTRSRMPELAASLIVLGCLAGVAALNMNTSVQVGDESIANIGLMDDRRIFVMIAGFIVVVGVILYATGRIIAQRTAQNQIPIWNEQAPRKYAVDRTMESDQYQLYLVKTYQIEKNNTLGKFVVNERLFASCDDALRYAHFLDVEAEENEEAKCEEEEDLEEVWHEVTAERGHVKAGTRPDARKAPRTPAEETPVEGVSAVVADWIARPKSGVPHSVVLQDLQEAVERQDVTAGQFAAIRRQLLS
jgi:hypothetical protein